jgi:hypothetical protein
MLGKTDVLRWRDLEKFEYTIRPGPVQLRDGVLILLRQNGAEDEVPVCLHLPSPQYCRKTVQSVNISFAKDVAKNNSMKNAK